MCDQRLLHAEVDAIGASNNVDVVYFPQRVECIDEILIDERGEILDRSADHVCCGESIGQVIRRIHGWRRIH